MQTCYMKRFSSLDLIDTFEEVMFHFCSFYHCLHSFLTLDTFYSLIYFIFQNDNMWRALLENAAQRKVLKYVPGDLAKRKDELLKLVLCD